MSGGRPRLLFLVSEDWYFCSHRLPLAAAARAAGYDVIVVTRVADHGDEIRRAGIHVIPFDISRGRIDPFGDLRTLGRLVAIYRRERPAVVHHVAMKPVLYGSIAARLAGHPHTINALAGMGWLFMSGAGHARAIKAVVRRALGRVLRAGLALVQNPDDEQVLIAMGVPASNIRRIAGSGVDLRVFHPQPEPPGIPIVVLPARLLWDKGVGEFVEAARALRRQGVAARFVLAGEPDAANPSAIPAALIADWVREGVVEHRGWVKDVPALLAGVHVVCLPSYREGLPKSLSEAAAAGRAIVTTDVPGCREVVRHGESGLLVPVREVEPLARALRTVIEDAALRRQMGAAARRHAEQALGLETAIGQTLALYEERAR